MPHHPSPVSNDAFLCGYFSAQMEPMPSMLSGWTRRTYTKEELANLSNYYFPEFAQCIAEDIHLYTLPIEKDCILDFGDEQVAFHINRLQLWVAPFRIILYAVSVRFDHQPFNSVTRALNALRNCAYYGSVQESFVRTALQPVMDLFHYPVPYPCRNA